MVPYYLRNIGQNEPKRPKNVQSRGRLNTFLNLVTTRNIKAFMENIKRMFWLSQNTEKYTQIRPKNTA